MVNRDHKLSLRKQCEVLQLSRSRLYDQPVGESAENLRFMEIIAKQFLENAVVWVAPDGQVHEAEWASMWPAPYTTVGATYEAGADLPGAKYQQKASPEQDLAIPAAKHGD